MSAKDIFHNAVKKALEKEKWNITHDPLFISFGGVEMYIDLGANRLIAAEKEREKIAVEVKSFLGASTISDFHSALGQFMNYQLALQQVEPDRVLYLAIPLDTYDSFFQLQFIQLVIQNYQIKLIIFEPTGEVIVQWRK